MGSNSSFKGCSEVSQCEPLHESELPNWLCDSSGDITLHRILMMLVRMDIFCLGMVPIQLLWWQQR
ncbi:hypothetical protein P691DRAFT_76391 [Macrolepiota fuliginosa MF-IS2]|uniref:Uncharacterized protein n=1 Tax=Macrolepiota fuliginosa MF-IS2 TaxID=1400762 RepID=A0A9P5WZN8_9AGAR|nr:hypothetical protein P691DRAFT_76391 [Macrolepiota fuliginosa MF-IS2]